MSSSPAEEWMTEFQLHILLPTNSDHCTTCLYLPRDRCYNSTRDVSLGDGERKGRKKGKRAQWKHPGLKSSCKETQKVSQGVLVPELPLEESFFIDREHSVEKTLLSTQWWGQWSHAVLAVDMKDMFSWLRQVFDSFHRKKILKHTWTCHIWFHRVHRFFSSPFMAPRVS